MKRLSQAEMEEWCHLGLCFNCNEKFYRGHNWFSQRIVLIDLAVADNGDDPDPEGSLISVLAIIGVRTSETMQIGI